ncbi:MAG: tRNA preQ1(34) S-adenosylmethionine ribosyltransferase-isomerase QueA [Desulfobacteraceae bacterium]|nr:tRNA preQ1(34) S-adenosylmethionine ribosyltransferase-isomerase QueA [Desulfobacteraceae bacterium]
MFRVSDYDYHLPEEKIAQQPVEKRSRSKLLRIDRQTHKISHHSFENILGLLKKGDLLVVNNTKVIPARLKGFKETGGKVEILIIDYAAGIASIDRTGTFRCDCLIKASKSPKKGAKLFLEDGVSAAFVEKRKGPVTEVSFSNSKGFLDYLKHNGQIPLPPYIKRTDNTILKADKTNYQTVYACKEGAVAAPTAGLHFTDELISQLEKKGVEFAKLTLHVGYGTFVPVKVDDIREHQIHSEYFSVSRKTAEKINRAKALGQRIVAVGTTSVRTLEYLSDESGRITEQSGRCDLYIYPGYQYKCVDAMITNFHLPQSTLLMLVSAFYDRKKILAAYETAVNENYRFFSYGDAMLIE